ncbi:CDK5RAP3-like protein [Thelohanellus kitauei]|uniref:CDK5RAP3-like protein n=1 Tax=Thelohanellus kitauei TaxID=669202 RepID=A0A0C2JG17_THEKT|nr:CDK5RAP3-like protein [Thelohanellus kitauei]
MDQDFLQRLPIDIHVDKLLEWLVSRKHCNRQWFKQYSFLVNQITEYLKSVKSAELERLFDNQGVNIFTIEDLSNRYPNLEADLNKFLQNMMENGVGLAGASAELARLMTELPALKKTSKDFQKQINNLEKKIAIKERYIQTAQTVFENKAQSYGISSAVIDQPLDIWSCLTSLDQELSLIWTRFGNILKPFQHFTNFIPHYRNRLDYK